MTYSMVIIVTIYELVTKYKMKYEEDVHNFFSFISSKWFQYLRVRDIAKLLKQTNFSIIYLDMIRDSWTLQDCLKHCLKKEEECNTVLNTQLLSYRATPSNHYELLIKQLSSLSSRESCSYGLCKIRVRWN